MKKIDIKELAVLSVGADKAWEVVGPNFINIAAWGRGINKSWKNEDAEIRFDGAPAGGRFCDLGKFGIADERILHYDQQAKEITWSAKVAAFPGFLSNLQNALSVEAIDENSCQISSNITADLSGIRGWLLGGALKKNFQKLASGFLKDWKTYAVTGEISASKKRELEKLKS